MQTERTSGTRPRLGGARADFVASLGKNLLSAERLLDEIELEPASTSAHEELRRKLHALHVGARSLRLESLDRALAEALGVLDRQSKVGGKEGDVAGLRALLRELPKQAWGEMPDRDKSAEPPRVEEAKGPSYTALVVGAARVADALKDKDPDGLRFDAETTQDAQIAFDLALALAPDLVIVDADVPDTAELVEALMDDPSMEQTPILVIGSFSVSGQAARFIALGVTKTIGKPISHATLRAACEEAIFTKEGRTIRLVLNEPTVAELGQRLADDIKHALVDVLDEAARSEKVSLGEGTEVFGALWGAIARVREVITARTGGTVRFLAGGPEGAIALAPSLEVDEGVGERRPARVRGLAEEVSLAGRVVVVADDDPGVTWFIADLLRGAGAIVHEALDGEQALRLAFENCPDLVVTDILMPKIDGFSLCRILKRDVVLRDVPVVLLSWKEDLLQRVRELNVGAAGYLRKESESRAILARLREALRTRARVEARLAKPGEVRGRLDGVTVRTLLGIVCTLRKEARVSVRDASFLYEVEIRGGSPVRATRTAGDGSFASGPTVLQSMLGVGAGRFMVATSTSEIPVELVGDLGQQLARPVAVARASIGLVTAASLPRVSSLAFDADLLADYLRATPERARGLLERIARGEAPASLAREGLCEATLLEELLVDLASRGAVRAVFDADGKDLFEPALAEALSHLDARARGLIGMTPSGAPAAETRGRRSTPEEGVPSVIVREALDTSPSAPMLLVERAGHAAPQTAAEPVACDEALADRDEAVPESTDVDEVRYLIQSVPIPVEEASLSAPAARVTHEHSATIQLDSFPQEETPPPSVAGEVGRIPKKSGWPLVLLAIVIAMGLWALISYAESPGHASQKQPEPPRATEPLPADGIHVSYTDIPQGTALEPGQGLLVIRHGGADEVRVDGASRGRAQEIRLPLWVGSHDVRFGTPRDGVERMVEVRPGQVAKVELTSR